MEQIRVIGLSKSFGVRQVFNKVSFEIKHGERVGLVGPNGAGKSTLMKCLLGIEDYDEGQIIKDSATTIGYLQQDINLGDDSLAVEIQKAFADVQYWEQQLLDVSAKLADDPHDESLLKQLARIQDRLDWLGGYDYEAQSRRIAYGLGFSDEDLTKSVSEFSGGQKTRINLAKALVRRPDFLFLDEPTNHLDMDMLEWLENYLSAYGGGILIISHDRYFLDRVTTRIVNWTIIRRLVIAVITADMWNSVRLSIKHNKVRTKNSRSIFVKPKSILINTEPALNLKWPGAVSLN